ncbi:MAG: tRNA 2-thiouridine(34) synthase MnmA [Ruminococcus sp.]|nr:tRNA 2-thiouridine(34) synthase MnmA [Ruminococcus sp.]
MKKALIAMSGGVDSSVASLLIKEAGYESVGITMKLYDNEDVGIKKSNTCCSLDDIADARAVCNKLGIPYYVFNFRDSFNEKVISRFIKAYENGSTPNPCIDCNKFIKFEHLMHRMKELEMDYVVTGHYARIEYDETLGRFILKKAVDDTKDQSYVLYSLTQDQLAHTLFPLGNMNKTEVRKIAEANGFINAKKHDSQDICFVPNGKYAEFIENYTGKKYEKGDFVDKKGNVLGEHKGIIRYTIGQRKGLGLALPEPMYVCEKDLENNKVILSSNEDLFTSELYADELNLITCDKITEPMRIKAKVRYNQKEQSATVTQVGKDRIHIVFDEPQRAICKGQAVVMYDGDVVVGGGTITE